MLALMVVRGRIVEPARSRNTTRTIFQQQRRSSSPSDTPSLSFRQMLAKKMRAHTHTSAKLRVHHKAAHEPEDSPLVGQGRKGDRHQHLHEVASCRVTSLQFSAATLFACTGLPDSKSSAHTLRISKKCSPSWSPKLKPCIAAAASQLPDFCF